MTVDLIAAKSTAGSTTSQPKDRRFNRLQNMYPVLRNQQLTNSMLSLIHNWRRGTVDKKRLHRVKRKGAFVVTDLDGNPMLVLRKQKARQFPNYPTQMGNNVQKSESNPSEAIPPNMVPFLYNLQNPNFGVANQPVVASMFPQPNIYPRYDSKAGEARNSLSDDEYYDNFEFIPLPAIKKRKVKKKEALATAGATTSISKPTKETVQREKKGVDQTKGVVNVVSLLASVLEQAFSVPHEAVLPNIKRESTLTSSSVDISVEEPQTVGVEQVSTPLFSVDKVIRALINSSVAQPLPITHECTSLAPIQKPISPMLEQLSSFTTPLNIKPEETYDAVTKLRPDWKNFQLEFAGSMLRGSTTPGRRYVTQEEMSKPFTDLPIIEVHKPKSADINSFWQDTSKTPEEMSVNTIGISLHKAEENTTQCTNAIDKILEIVEDIREEGKKSKVKEDLPCNIVGSWASAAGGVLLEIENCNDSLQAYSHPKTPAAKKGFLLENDWEFKVFKPFSKNDVVILNGLNEKYKKVVSFIGECRTCSATESISGNWLLGRPSSNCKDQKSTEELFSDVWTRETLTARQRRKLKSIKEREIKRVKERAKKEQSATTAS